MQKQDRGSEWPDQSLGEQLSALADGEADAAETASVLQAWPRQELLRRQWHAYQLVGDTLRSAELAQDGRRTQALLERLRPQLAAEPVPLRPTASLPAGRWFVPAAVAAGFMALAVGLSSLTATAPVDAPRLAALPLSASWLPPPAHGLSFAQSAAPQGVAQMSGLGALQEAWAPDVAEPPREADVRP
ncbi:MAG TPA: sigma-E factor negative regulatory protein [Roseateles sp.]|nr:sigma-E factor negative regulatory protein [Roseateles sp.]